MRNLWRLLAFDILAPLAAIAALLAIGLILGWPLWWVSACSVLVLLIVEGVGVNFWLLRRDAVSVGTDDDAPGLRLAVVFLCTAALVAAVLTGRARHGRELAVQLNGGELKISWPAEDQPVLMTGPAVTVYRGELKV